MIDWIPLAIAVVLLLIAGACYWLLRRRSGTHAGNEIGTDGTYDPRLVRAGNAEPPADSGDSTPAMDPRSGEISPRLF